MFFYEFSADIKNMEDFLSDAQDSNMRRDAISDISDDLKYIADRISDERKNSCFIFIKNLGVRNRSYEAAIRGGAISSEKEEVIQCVKLLEERSEMVFKDTVIKEVTFSQVVSETRYPHRFRHRDMQKVFRDFDIEGMEDCVWFNEMLIAERDKDEESFLQQAKLYLCKESLVPELKRIFTKCPVEKN